MLLSLSLRCARVYGHVIHVFALTVLLMFKLREEKTYVAIYVTQGEVNVQHPLLILVPSSMVSRRLSI